MRSSAPTAGARVALLVAGFLAWGCERSAGSPEATWLAREPGERVAQLERQLRGFDVAMLETGHRYAELYWAGRDANWEAAAYHVEKIRLAIENGLERRPKRAASARSFLDGPLSGLGAAVASREPEQFDARFRDLTAGCNSCHGAENVPFFEVRPPEARLSPIHRIPPP
jgi:hypothetical protein